MIRLRRLFSISVCALYLELCTLFLEVCGDQVQSTKDKAPKSQLQNARLIHVQRLTIAEDGDNDSQTHRRFRGRYGHNDEHKKLSGDVLKETRKRNEGQIHSIQHQLNAHEHRDDVALDDHTRHADREKDRGERQVP